MRAVLLSVCGNRMLGSRFSQLSLEPSWDRASNTQDVLLALAGIGFLLLIKMKNPKVSFQFVSRLFRPENLGVCMKTLWEINL